MVTTHGLGLWDGEGIFTAFLYQVTLPTDARLSIVTSAPVQGSSTVGNLRSKDGRAEMQTDVMRLQVYN